MGILTGVTFNLLIATSFHFSTEEYNWLHPHVRAEYKTYNVGLYYNSIKRPSVYISKRLSYKKAWLEVGGVTGYKYKVIPLMRSGYTVNDKIELFLLPGYDSNGLFAVIGAEYKFF